METDRTIISMATLDERIVAEFARFLKREPTADDAADLGTLLDFLDYGQARASLGLSRSKLSTVFERVNPIRRPRKPRRKPRPYVVLTLQG